MSWPAPTRAAHEKFCRIRGWTPVRDATGRIGSHHVTYELALPDGRSLRSRVSHPPDRSTYGPALWSHILRDQLDVSESAFWSAVQDKVLPPRTVTTPAGETLPAELVVLLINRVGMTRGQLVTMSKAEAIERLNRYWTEGS